MMAVPWAWGAALALLLTLTLLVTPGAGVQCFVCSYSPRGNTSRVDGCTKANFTEEKIETRECALGCESVAAYDRNGNCSWLLVRPLPCPVAASAVLSCLLPAHCPAYPACPAWLYVSLLASLLAVLVHSTSCSISLLVLQLLC